DDDAVLIAAAGNDNDQDFFYPASYEVVLSVAATDAQDVKAGFSSYNSQVDISAPGQEIVINFNTPVSGTSYASPIVSGAAALLRAHYPDWNATQIKARLISTADNIYNIDENQSYLGQLGSGRLNMFRALNDETKAVNLSSFEFIDASNNVLTTGLNTRLRVNLINFLDPLSDIKIKLESLSPFVMVEDSVSELGSIPTFQSFNNDPDLFQLQIENNTPANTEAVLQLTYQDGGFTYQEEIRLLLNPSSITENQVKLTLDDRGRLAVLDNSFDQLFGMQFQNRTLLKEAGLMIGIQEEDGTIKVSDAVRSELGGIDQDFNLITSFRKNTLDTISTTMSRYEDITNNSERIGLEVYQKTYTWFESDLNECIIIEYEIKNISTDFISLENLQVGLFANWSIDNDSESI
ncbi:MAG: S8 family serine peptidase, partial [Bacteroidota bacterium]